ncbi:MAG: putative pre6S rRNA nuclease [Chloroflexota bacterium]|jgi:putative Holliday junction resolvase|nr:putative pre6S rRNA nuclease [Chloroflexota bacterium]
MSVLGIDLGERRIGVAIVDGPSVGARPLTTLRRGRHVGIDADALLALITTHGITELVVGLPIDAAGHEGPQATLTRTWVEDIRGRLGDDIAITLHDERLSSHVAEGRVGPMKRGRSGGPPSRKQRDEYRARIDREAAAVILQDALDTRQPGSRRAPQASTPEIPS